MGTAADAAAVLYYSEYLGATGYFAMQPTDWLPHPWKGNQYGK